MRQAFGGRDQNAFHLLRRKIGVGFEHTGDDGRNDRRGKRSSVDVFVIAVDDIFIAYLQRDDLPQSIDRLVKRGIELGNDTRGGGDDTGQVAVLCLIENFQKRGFLGGRRVGQDRRRNPDAGRNYFGLLKTIGRRPIRRAVLSALGAIDRIIIAQPADRDRRRRAGRRKNGVARRVASVSHRADDYQPAPQPEEVHVV